MISFTADFYEFIVIAKTLYFPIHQKSLLFMVLCKK